MLDFDYSSSYFRSSDKQAKVALYLKLTCDGFRPDISCIFLKLTCDGFRPDISCILN